MLSMSAPLLADPPDFILDEPEDSPFRLAFLIIAAAAVVFVVSNVVVSFILTDVCTDCMIRPS